MEKIETSDFPRANFDNSMERGVEYKSYKDGITSLNSNSELAGISGEDTERELITRLQNVMQISQSSVGLLFACAQILNDWHYLREFGLNLGDWNIQVYHLIEKLKQESDFETDRLQAKSIRNPILKLLSRNPSKDFSLIQKESILAKLRYGTDCGGSG